jgi:hypothetical protein
VNADALAGSDRTERLKARIGGALKRRFFLRFHVSLILLFTFCAGLVTTRVLLWLGIDTMWARYLLAMLVAYGAFLVGVRLWLAYVGASALPDAGLPGTSANASRKDACKGSGGLDLPFDFGGGGGGGAGGRALNLPFRGGGGADFAGGGASDSFVSADAGADLLRSGGDSAGASGSGSGSGFSLDLGDADGIVVLLLALLVLLAVVGSAAWIIWIGPEILVEAAFEAMLAGGLVKSLHGSGIGGWMGRVLWKTLLPFTLVAASAVAFAAIGQSAYPDARTFREVVRAAWLGEKASGLPLVPVDPDPDVARVDEELSQLGPIEKLTRAADRGRASALLVERGGKLARARREEEMMASYDQALSLVRADDAVDLQTRAADAMRLKGYALAEAGKSDAALATYAGLRERFSGATDPELQWRLAWAMLQEAILSEGREEGSGLALMQEVARRYAASADRQVRVQVSTAFYTQGLADIWRAKKGGGTALAATMPAAVAKFESVLATSAPDTAEAAKALAGIAYGRFLLGDRAGAQQALARIPVRQRDWIRSSEIGMYLENRVLPADAEFRSWSDQQLKAGNG